MRRARRASAITPPTAPTVSITTPSDAETVSGIVEVLATADDDVGVSRVEFLVGDILIGADTAAPFAAAWDTTLTSNGGYLLSARAYDASGNRGDSAPVGVTVENAEPAPPPPEEEPLATGDIILYAVRSTAVQGAAFSAGRRCFPRSNQDCESGLRTSAAAARLDHQRA